MAHLQEHRSERNSDFSTKRDLMKDSTKKKFNPHPSLSVGLHYSQRYTLQFQPFISLKTSGSKPILDMESAIPVKTYDRCNHYEERLYWQMT